VMPRFCPNAGLTSEMRQTTMNTTRDCITDSFPVLVIDGADILTSCIEFVEYFFAMRRSLLFRPLRIGGSLRLRKTGHFGFLLEILCTFLGTVGGLSQYPLAGAVNLLLMRYQSSITLRAVRI
jgi:hypothetical protein